MCHLNVSFSHVSFIKVIFGVPNGHEMLNGSSNEFYDLKESTHILGAAVHEDAAIIIDGKQQEITKIMVFSEKWITDHYLTPMSNQLPRLERIMDGSSRSQPTRRAVGYQNSYQNSYQSSYR